MNLTIGYLFSEDLMQYTPRGMIALITFPVLLGKLLIKNDWLTLRCISRDWGRGGISPQNPRSTSKIVGTVPA